jgi:hypothetical protein
METRRPNSMYMLQGKLLYNAYIFDFRDHKEKLDLS